MTSPTVDRSAPLVRRIGSLDGNSQRGEAVALGLVDALLDRDGQTLAAALDALRGARAQADNEFAAWLDAAIAFAQWGTERVPTNAGVAQGTQAHAFLQALDGQSQLGSAELRELLEVDETQVSRTGRRLLDGGLVARRKVGRQVFWELTPRGRRALSEASTAQPRGAHSDFWQEALRRGFERAYGDEPGEPRSVDPTRERVVKSALELHATRGIVATTWPQIADKAGVPVETVEALFPTLDDLARGCGAHFFELLQLPPNDRASDLFTGLSSENERVHRLVETLFAAYERGADGIVVARREAKDVPAVSESVAELDSAFDAIVVEALRPQPADYSSIASLRALTDVGVWRTLRDQGATPVTAVDQATTVVERWLEARPSL